MRTVIAPLAPEVKAQIRALAPAVDSDIARRFIRRLRLEPLLGSRVIRGALAHWEARRIYFDHDSNPEDLLRSRRVATRCGNDDLAEGPRYRIVYQAREAPASEIRLIIVLAVRLGHAQPPSRCAYDLAEDHLRRLVIERSER